MFKQYVSEIKSNKDWIDFISQIKRMIEYLELGDAVVFVGASYVPGVSKLLSENGYQIKGPEISAVQRLSRERRGTIFNRYISFRLFIFSILAIILYFVYQISQIPYITGQQNKSVSAVHSKIFSHHQPG